MTDQAEVLLTAGAAARRLGISVQHIGRLADRGHLPPAATYGPGYRLFRVADLDRWAEQRAAKQVAARSPPGGEHETAAGSTPWEGREPTAPHREAVTSAALDPIVGQGRCGGQPAGG